MKIGRFLSFTQTRTIMMCVIEYANENVYCLRCYDSSKCAVRVFLTNPDMNSASRTEIGNPLILTRIRMQCIRPRGPWHFFRGVGVSVRLASVTEVDNRSSWTK